MVAVLNGMQNSPAVPWTLLLTVSPPVLALPYAVPDRLVLSSLCDIVVAVATVGDDVHSLEELL